MYILLNTKDPKCRQIYTTKPRGYSKKNVAIDNKEI